MNNLFLKYFISSFAFILILFASHAAARIGAPDFKGVTDVFHPDALHYSPTLGHPALEARFIENLRLFNVKPSFSENGRREYATDGHNDATMALLKMLFPSPAGTLTTVSNHKFNFGRLVDKPKTVALLMNFASVVERNKWTKEDREADRQAFAFQILDSLKLYNEDIDALTAITNDYIRAMSLVSTELSFIKLRDVKDLEDHFKQVVEQIPKSQKKVFGSVEKLVKTYQKKTEKACKTNQVTLRKVLLREYESKTKTQLKYYQKVVDTILEALEDSVLTSDDVYPKNFTQQLLSAFFCLHFNNRGDLKELLMNMSEDMVDKELVQRFDVNDHFTIDDIENLSEKPHYSFDEIVALSSKEVFRTRVLPYTPNTPLLSNHLAHPYKRELDRILYDRYFPDCTEMAIRHIFNFLLYDSASNSWNFSFLDLPDENIYFKRLRKFYENHDVNSVSDGSITTRSAWNTVVGDLNDGEFKIRYESFYDLNGDFKNVINVFGRLLGISFQQREETPQAWVSESLQKIFQTINKKYTYKIYSSLTTQGDMINGTVTVRVFLGNESIFSFKMKSTSLHFELVDLDFGYVANDVDEKAKNSLTPGTSEELLLLIQPNENLRRHVSSPMHALYGVALNDAAIIRTQLQSLNDLSLSHEDFHHPPRLSLHQSITKNMLASLPWMDRRALTNVVGLVATLYKNPLFKDALVDGCRGLIFNPERIDISLDELHDFVNLEFLFIVQMNGQLDVTRFRRLKELNWGQGTPEIFDASQLHQLETLSFFGSPVVEIRGLQELRQLKTIRINDCAGLSSLNMKGLASLERLEIVGSPRVIIESFYDARNLKQIDMRGNGLWESRLKNIDLSHFQNLQSAKIASHAVETISVRGLKGLLECEFTGKNLHTVEGLDDLVALQRLLLTANLSTLDLTNLSKLENLDVEGIALHNIKSLNPNNLPKLNYLSARFPTHELMIEFEQSMPESWPPNCTISCPTGTGQRQQLAKLAKVYEKLENNPELSPLVSTLKLAGNISDEDLGRIQGYLTVDEFLTLVASLQGRGCTLL